MKNQAFNDGIVKIYEVGNTSEPGGMPTEGLIYKQTLRYKERTVGLTRYYAAIKENVEVSAVIRCPQVRSVKANNIAILTDGEQYRIELVQYPEDIEPPVMDLTLEKVSDFYDVG